MNWRSMGLPRIYLQPGMVHIAESPAILETLLGSCVALTLWDTQSRRGAMSHSLFPAHPPRYPETEFGKYVDASIDYLLDRFEQAGLDRSRLETKVFGGADVLPTLCGTNLPPTIGRQNMAAVLRALEQRGVAVAARDLGGRHGRKLAFHTGCGEVRVWRLPALHERGTDLC